MTSKQSRWAGFLIAGALFMGASQASAQFIAQANSFSFIGKISSGQGKIVSFNGSTGACNSSVNLGNTSGLTVNTIIVGTSTTDSVHMVSSPTTICGITLTTITTRGFSIQIRGEGSGDLLDAGAFANMTLVGNSGSDILNHPSFNAVLFGTSGNDELRGSTNGQFRGETGSDKMCAGAGTTVNLFAGGAGEFSSNNIHCGIGPATNSTLNCADC
jgi:hypothetical protein